MKHLLPVLFLTVLGAWAQSNAINGQIEGTITDAAGAAVPGAKVKVRNTATGLEREAESNADGLYRFAVLPLGGYIVEVAASGFAPAQFSGITLSAGEVRTINAQLQLGEVRQVITVGDSAPVVDPGRTDLGFTLSGNLTNNLPLISRNPFNFILNQPNVSGRPNTEFGVPRRVNANGFNNRINFQIDGNNNVQSDRAGIRLIPISNTFVEEVQQVSNGFNAEFGNSVGTVFNTITKSGSNQFHGEGGWLFRRTGFSARPALLAEGRPAPETNVNSIPLAVGGPIRQDKLFFFGAYERVKRDIPQIVTSTVADLTRLGLPADSANAIPFRQQVTFFLAKVDYQLNSNHRLTGRFNGHRNDSPFNGGGGFTLSSRTYNFVDRSYVTAFQWIGTFGPSIVSETRFQAPLRNQQQLRFSGSGEGPAITIPGIALFGGPTAVGFQYRELAPELSSNVSILRGNHMFKVGINLRPIRDRQVQATAATYTFPTIDSYLAARDGRNTRGYTNFAQTLGEPSIEYNLNFWNFYAQDTWKLKPRLTLSYGLRYDLYQLPTPAANSALSISQSFRTDRNNFGPRFGLSAALDKTQKTVLRIGGGVFYDAPQTDMYRTAIVNNGSPRFFNVSTAPTTAFAPAFPNVFSSVPTGFNLPIQDVTAMSPDFRTLYSMNANVSLSRQLSSSMAVTATYLFTKGTGLPIYSNTNLIPSTNRLEDGRVIFGAGRINPAFGNIIVGQSVGNSNYNGLNLTLNKRLSSGLEGFVTWTWSHAIDDAPERNNIDSANGFLSDITNRRRDRGNSLNDRRHAFNATGLWQPKFQFASSALRRMVNDNRLSLSLVAQSGDVFNIGSNRILNGDPTAVVAVQRPLYVGRNTYIGPRTVQLDARFSRLVPVNETFRAELFAEVTNLFNKTNVTALNSTATVDPRGVIAAQPNYAWTGALDQRLLQFGMMLRF
jgi:hypothetical protein